MVIYGATLLMFMLGALSGLRVVQLNSPGARDWFVVGLAIALGYLVSLSAGKLTFLSAEVIMILQFPVSTGAMLAIVFEWAIPGRVRDVHASA